MKFAQRLENAGITREQAIAFAEAQKDSLSEALETQLATISDIALLRSDMKDFRSELKEEVFGVKAEIATLRWMMGVLFAIAIANFAKQYF